MVLNVPANGKLAGEIGRTEEGPVWGAGGRGSGSVTERSSMLSEVAGTIRDWCAEVVFAGFDDAEQDRVTVRGTSVLWLVGSCSAWSKEAFKASTITLWPRGDEGGEHVRRFLLPPFF